MSPNEGVSLADDQQGLFLSLTTSYGHKPLIEPSHKQTYHVAHGESKHVQTTPSTPRTHPSPHLTSPHLTLHRYAPPPMSLTMHVTGRWAFRRAQLVAEEDPRFESAGKESSAWHRQRHQVRPAG